MHLSKYEVDSIIGEIWLFFNVALADLELLAPAPWVLELKACTTLTIRNCVFNAFFFLKKKYS